MVDLRFLFRAIPEKERRGITMGAGILPIALHRGEAYCLLGREAGSGEWSDFGGSPNHGEDCFQTAAREGYEELNGLLGSEKDMARLVSARLNAVPVSSHYITFLVPVEYDASLPGAMRNTYEFARARLARLVGRGGLYEKSDAAWVRVSALSGWTRKLRRFFRPGAKEIASMSRRLREALQDHARRVRQRGS